MFAYFILFPWFLFNFLFCFFQSHGHSIAASKLLSQLVAHMQLHTVDALPDEMPKSSLSDSILIYKDHFDKVYFH